MDRSYQFNFCLSIKAFHLMYLSKKKQYNKKSLSSSQGMLNFGFLFLNYFLVFLSINLLLFPFTTFNLIKLEKRVKHIVTNFNPMNNSYLYFQVKIMNHFFPSLKFSIKIKVIIIASCFPLGVAHFLTLIQYSD